MFPGVGQISGDLSYCLHLLIGVDGVEVDHGGRLSAMGSVWVRIPMHPVGSSDNIRSVVPGYLVS